MQQTKDLVIGGKTITMQHFMATKGLKVLTRLTKLLGKPLAEMAGGADKDIMEVLPNAIGALVDRLDENDVESLIKELIGSCFINGQPIKDSIFETTFAGKSGEMFELCIEVVRFQYGDFLSGLLAKKDTMMAMTKKEPSVQSI